MSATMADDLGNTSMQMVKQAPQVLLEILKFLNKLNPINKEEIINGIKGIATKLNDKFGNTQVHQNELVKMAQELKDTVVVQDGITKKDMAAITAKAKEYGVPIAFTGNKKLDNMKVSILSSQKELFSQIMTDIVKDKLTEKPKDFTYIKVGEKSAEALRSELVKNDLPANFIKNKDGELLCVYEVANKKAFELTANSVENIVDKVDKTVEISPEKDGQGFFKITDKSLEKDVIFDNAITREELINKLKNELDYSEAKAILTADKFTENGVMTVKELDNFKANSPESLVNEWKENIVLENENLLTQDYSFNHINLKENGLNSFVIMDKDGRIATLIPDQMNAKQMGEVITERLGITDVETQKAIVAKTISVNDIYRKTDVKNHSHDIENTQGIGLGKCEIDRVNKNEFKVNFNTDRAENRVVGTYNFANKKSAIEGITANLVTAGVGYDLALKSAREIYNKAQAQSAEKIAVQNHDLSQIKGEKVANIASLENGEREIIIDREIGGKFRVALKENPELCEEYDLTNKAETTEKLMNDWGIEQSEAEEIIQKADNQDAIENEMERNEGMEENIEQTQTLDNPQVELSPDMPEVDDFVDDVKGR